ncbi:MAG: hypothetical protein BWY74_02737 [Firmicutes bacterium ADurb.Bin419]|nr:MAG: hypothetical protein BWY74_02737 [Firmicutes bacterium ADurb.Bin419]
MKRVFLFFIISAIISVSTFLLAPSITSAATTLPINLVFSNKVIPDSTSLLPKGVVLDSKPTYRFTVRAEIFASVNFSGATLTFNNPNTSTVVRSGTGTHTLQAQLYAPNAYRAYVYTTYDVRGTVSSFSCSATVSGNNFTGSKTSNTSFSVGANYSSQFRITYYVIAKESDYTGTYSTTALGISSSKKFKYSFLEQVKVQGSGYSHYNEYMQYNSQTGYFSIVSYPKTATGTIPTVNKTIAVDQYYIPRKSITSGLAKVNITNVGDRQAEDGGGAITGRKIDVFYGTGLPSTPPSWSATYKNVYYYGNNLW